MSVNILQFTFTPKIWYLNMSRILGDHSKKWCDIQCNHLSDKEGKKICKLASELARRDAEVESAYICTVCEDMSEPHSKQSAMVQMLASKTAKANREELRLTASQKLGDGVGTELHKMIPNFLESSTCNCKSYAKKMNIWGPDSCEKNRDHIISHLVHESKDTGLFGWVPESATRMVASKLLDTAIARTRRKEQNSQEKYKWFCAVTTAPRKVPTLDTCLESMQIAGFEPFIFAEPDSPELSVEFDPFLIRNEEKKGVWFNWINSLHYALENTDANVIMTVQDDSLFHPDCKSFLEDHVLWPDTQVGFVSLYTPKHYSIKPRFKTVPRPTGVNRVITRSLWGACALVWPRKIVEEMLEDPILKGWMGAPTKTKTYWEKIKKQRKEEPWRVQNSDTAIGKIMNNMHRTMWFCDPSPVQHIAETSAINHGGNRGRRNCGRCADWKVPLEEQIPLQTNGKTLDRFEYEEIESSKQ